MYVVLAEIQRGNSMSAQAQRQGIFEARILRDIIWHDPVFFEQAAFVSLQTNSHEIPLGASQKPFGPSRNKLTERGKESDL